MKSFTQQEIQVKLANEKFVPLMVWVKGIFAIHTHQSGNSPFFVVTHVPTGEGIFYFTKTSLPGLTVTESKRKAQRLVELLEDLELTYPRPKSLELREVAYRVEMVRFNLSLADAIANIDKKCGTIEEFKYTLRRCGVEAEQIESQRLAHGLTL